MTGAQLGDVEHNQHSLPATSVVIPTYNRGVGLASIVRPLLDDPFLQDIVVVVDGCKDGSIELLQELARTDSRLKPVWIPNAGEMGARSVGIQRASGEIVLLLDDDVRTRPGLAQRHAGWHAQRVGLVVLGYMPTVSPADHVGARFSTRLYAQEYERACKRYEERPAEILDHLWAGNISLRRNDALRVGMDNTEYAPTYHADREFGLRCQKAGLVGVFDRSLEAEHVHSRSLDAFRRDARAQGAGRQRLYELHGDLIGEPPKAEFEQGLAPPLGALVKVTRRPRAYRLVTAGLSVTLSAADRFRLSAVEIPAAKLLRRVEQRMGAALV